MTFAPRGAIKSQMLADFVLEISTPPGEDTALPWTLSLDGDLTLEGAEQESFWRDHVAVIFGRQAIG
ncbi:hypothetical protein A2U01_0099855 [Trifolium medium]|uniref:Uncharacterized protein n=1 Tax=Trifolium medium TaxID=97028 RepID=A0A392UV23_9FABA|nr:hypothetical protein [Trifolium medium]